MKIVVSLMKKSIKSILRVAVAEYLWVTGIDPIASRHLFVSSSSAISLEDFFGNAQSQSGGS